MSENCPCGSQQDYSLCCEPLINGLEKAATAEQLMRSRYTAFVKEAEPYILKTWHHKTRPQKLNFEDNRVVWLGLEIFGTEAGGGADTEGAVEFSCSYLEDGKICTLTEKSAFVREDDLWLYLKGDCDVSKVKPERNSKCPCGSGKKYKKCCLGK